MRAKLRDIVHLYDGFLVDQFGVLLDGTRAYDGAVEALDQIAATGKPLIVLSNSGKRSSQNCERLIEFGFSRASFKTVLTSGEIALGHITSKVGREIPHGAKTLIIIRGGDTALTVDLPLEETSDPRDAQLVVIVSPTLGIDLSHYVDLLRDPAARGVPCICVNPDQVMLTSECTSFGAGRIAREYEVLGGTVTWIGKPFPAIYEAAQRLMSTIPKKQILCIGDSPEHDIAGGQRAGMPTALVRTGIHADLSDAEVANICMGHGVIPDHVLSTFSF